MAVGRKHAGLRDKQVAHGGDHVVGGEFVVVVGADPEDLAGGLIDADKVEAVLKNGVLTIKLPKAETAKPRRIQVHAK